MDNSVKNLFIIIFKVKTAILWMHESHIVCSPQHDCSAHKMLWYPYHWFYNILVMTTVIVTIPIHVENILINSDWIWHSFGDQNPLGRRRLDVRKYYCQGAACLKRDANHRCHWVSTMVLHYAVIFPKILQVFTWFSLWNNSVSMCCC